MSHVTMAARLVALQALLREFAPEAVARDAPGAPLPPPTPGRAPGRLALHLAELHGLCAGSAPAALPMPAVRMLHHLAFTGGDWVVQCLSAVPNLRVIEAQGLFPGVAWTSCSHASGLTRQMRGEIPPPIAALWEDARRRGIMPVLRDAAQDRVFGTADAIAPGPRDDLGPARVDHAVIVVGHPLRSWLHLCDRQEGARAGQSGALMVEDYALRYHAFLDDHAGVAVMRTEDAMPDLGAWMARLCALLGLRPDPEILARMSCVQRVAPARQWRLADRRQIAAAAVSAPFGALLDRLGYTG